MFNEKKDYYKILGVERDCSINDIVDAYYKIKFGSVFDLEKECTVDEAFKVLTTPKIKKLYDSSLYLRKIENN